MGDTFLFLWNPNAYFKERRKKKKKQYISNP